MSGFHPEERSLILRSRTSFYTPHWFSGRIARCLREGRRFKSDMGCLIFYLGAGSAGSGHIICNDEAAEFEPSEPPQDFYG